MTAAMRESAFEAEEPRGTLAELPWDAIEEPGAYVDRKTGDLYRIPDEALRPGGPLWVRKEGREQSQLVQISRNPFVSTLEARLRCAQHNIVANF